jgi:hypothetical protein
MRGNSGCFLTIPTSCPRMRRSQSYSKQNRSSSIPWILHRASPNLAYTPYNMSWSTQSGSQQAVLLLSAPACGPTGSSQPDVDTSSTPRPGAAQVEPNRAHSGPYAHAFSDPLVQNTYTVAVDSCFYDPPAKLASELGVSNDREAIARAYSMGSTAGPHRDAGYIGCLEGLSAPGAGQKKQFGR